MQRGAYRPKSQTRAFSNVEGDNKVDIVTFAGIPEALHRCENRSFAGQIKALATAGRTRDSGNGYI